MDREEYLHRTSQDCTVILFDAAWDVIPGNTIKSTFNKAKEKYSNDVIFGNIDVDLQKEIAQELSLKNVPAVGYFKFGQLIDIVTGADQSIENNIETLLRNKQRY